MEELQPVWTFGEAPAFLTKTGTQYARTNLRQTLNERDLSNDRLDQLVAALPPGAFISGGYMNAVMKGNVADATDIDIFFSSSAAFLTTYDMLTKPRAGEDASVSLLKGYEPEVSRDILLKDSKTIRFVKFKNPEHAKWPPIQLIKLAWYDNAEHVLDSFDFTIVQFATDGKDLVYNPLGILDLARKKIVLHRMQFPTSTLRRLIKYASKGFYACPGSLARIATETMVTMRDNPGVEQYAYID